MTEELNLKRQEFTLQQRKITTSAQLHDDNVKRGELLIKDIARNIQVQMNEIAKDRIHLDDAEVELQFLKEELVNYRERQRKFLEEQKQNQLAQMQDDDTATEGSVLRDVYACDVYKPDQKGNVG